MHGREPSRAAFRPLTETDLGLLVRWLGEPHVFRWWHESDDPEAVRGQYLPRILGQEAIRCSIASWGGEPCGLFQHYRWRVNPSLAAEVGAGPQDEGIDYLIGVPQLTGRGLGAVLVAAFIAEVVCAPVAPRAVLADVNLANMRSRRTLEKVGFEFVADSEFFDQGERYVVYRLADPLGLRRA